MKSKKTFYLLGFLIFLIFLKIDFRITNDLVCCNDDYDYFSHAETISEDFDFDYTNQLPDKSRYYRNNKNAPFGFLGAGLLSSPFMLIGSFVDQIFNNKLPMINLKNLIYSFSSIFYLIFSMGLIKKISQFFNVKINYTLYLFGSGIIYYAFERYSMTSVYEVFTILLTIHLSILFIKNSHDVRVISFLLPLSILLALLVRWTNLFVLLIPFIIIIRFNKEKPGLLKQLLNRYYFLSLTISIGLFSLLSKLIYGVITFSPSYVYMVDEFDNLVQVRILQNFPAFIKDSVLDFINIMFSQEFGLFWFSPIVFIGTTLVMWTFFTNKDLESLISNGLLLICFAQNFFIVSIWNSTASSFGFRYLFSLIPLSFLAIFMNKEIINSKLVKNYLRIFSIFSILSVLFFETTIFTQLSLTPVVNSFGYEKVYSQPEYLTGLLKSFFVPESYLKIIATSFFGAVFLKLSLMLTSETFVTDLLFSTGYVNDDVLRLISQLNESAINYFVFLLILSSVSTFFIVRHYLASKI